MLSNGQQLAVSERRATWREVAAKQEERAEIAITITTAAATYRAGRAAVRPKAVDKVGYSWVNSTGRSLLTGQALLSLRTGWALFTLWTRWACWSGWKNGAPTA